MSNENAFERALRLEDEAAEWEATADVIDRFENKGKRVHYALQGTAESRRKWATMLRTEANKALTEAMA